MIVLVLLLYGCSSPTGQSGSTKYSFNTVADLSSSTNLVLGDVVEVVGFYAKGDGGGHQRILQETRAGGGIEIGSMFANVIPKDGVEVDLAWFGARAADPSAVKNAWDEANSYDQILARGSFHSDEELRIRSGKRYFLYADFTFDSTNGFVADHADHFSVDGRLQVNNTASSKSGTGFLVKESLHYSVSNLSISGFEVGFESDGGDQISSELSRSRISSVTADANSIGMRFLPGFSGEYISVSSSLCTNNSEIGLVLNAGNVTFIGGQVTHNSKGICMSNATNGQHSTVSATSINHNNVYQLYCDHVIQGENFSSCEFYDNNSGQAGIVLDNCRGVNISGGTIGCDITYLNDGFSSSRGMNLISGNYFPVTRQFLGSGPTFVSFKDNFDPAGSWQFND